MIRLWPIAFLLAALLVVGCAPSRVAEQSADAPSGAERSFSEVLADQRLRGRIQGFILNDNELLDRANVNVTVFNRVVLLTGEVPNRDAGMRLANFARSDSNTRHVYNELVVANLSSAFSRSQDRMISTAAGARLMTLNDLPDNFDRDRIRVVTARQRLFLLGAVTREEADIITDALRRVRGVREVVRMFDYLD
ncbi:osmotically-inducible protein OsmY [Natronocella acetinitrilica]|uniref:Osmotically-inducible protein OsmY n=1 Tax=Natronocella acetinitrilica TaxID=414046 RepID=A0AAE3G1M1_9GAMM|nr:BON domain-containing protein [Natronocella acetinitrilica]MCP1673869.1 osmotically-inducible protein OsmY [Natronocella acetinitrilica]